MKEELRAWSDVIAGWAHDNQYVAEAWLFGSRVRGSNRKNSDLDVALVMAGPDQRTRLGNWICLSDGWKTDLQALLPVKLDLQQWDKDISTEIVGPAIEREGLMIFRRDGENENA